MNEKSRFVTVAMPAIAKKITAVIPPASPISWPPLRNPSATDRIGASISPAMKVKPKSAGTPHALLRSAVTPKSAPIITPNISSGAMTGDAANRLRKFNCIPAHAPATVGSIDSDSSQ